MLNELYRNIQNQVDQALLDTHTAFLGTVTSINLNVCTVQPLCMYRERGETAKKASIITNIPMITLQKTIIYIYDDTGEIETVKEDIKSGDVVLCVCCERNISEARNGNLNLPPVGHHNMADSVVTGALVQVKHITGGE